MDFKDQLLMLAERIRKVKDNVKTEEATKTSFVLPFLQTLGYDIFNPQEVTPECDCDYGTKKGEKIDYTVCLDGEPVMLVECKHWSAISISIRRSCSGIIMFLMQNLVSLQTV